MRPKERTRKKPPKALALIDQDGCTGCEVCLYFCPVAGCISKTVGPAVSEPNGVCEVVPELCIGCELCVKVCPWETIRMVPVISPVGEASPVAHTDEGESP
jgi:electron transport complex protein RnfB